MTYTVRRSKFSLYIGYFLAESLLLVFLVGMVIIWRDEPTYLDWPMAIASWIVVALFFHLLLFIGTFYKVQVNGDEIEYHAFLRKTKKLTFSDIKKITIPQFSRLGVDLKVVGHDDKTLFYVKLTDRNFDRFMRDISVRREIGNYRLV